MPTPARSRPGLRSASASGPTHHARHDANAAAEPSAATVPSSLPARRVFADREPSSSSDAVFDVLRAAASPSTVSARSDCATAATSAPAAVHTESSRIARSVSVSRSGASASSRRAPSRRATMARGAYRPFTETSFFKRLRAASSRNAVSVRAEPTPRRASCKARASSTSSNVSKLRCVSFTVCDSGSSQFAHKMSHTRSREDGGKTSSSEKVTSFFFVLEPSATASALTRTNAARSAAAAWYLWCESSGRSKEAQMYGNK